MISIGAGFGGPELKGSAVQNAIRAAMRAASESSRPDYDNGKSGWVNPIFDVPGSICQPEFEGFKKGHFSAKKKGVSVVIAVPEEATRGEHINEAIFWLLKEATEFGARFLAAKKIPFDQVECDRILTDIAKVLNVDPRRTPPRPGLH